MPLCLEEETRLLVYSLSHASSVGNKFFLTSTKLQSHVFFCQMLALQYIGSRYDLESFLIGLEKA